MKNFFIAKTFHEYKWKEIKFHLPACSLSLITFLRSKFFFHATTIFVAMHVSVNASPKFGIQNENMWLHTQVKNRVCELKIGIQTYLVYLNYWILYSFLHNNRFFNTKKKIISWCTEGLNPLLWTTPSCMAIPLFYIFPQPPTFSKTFTTILPQWNTRLTLN